MAPEKWLVTGGLGFIGVNLVERIVDRAQFPAFAKECGLPAEALDQVEIRVFDNGVTAVRDNFSELVSSRVEVVRGDIRDIEALGRAIDGVTRVIHLAAHAGVVPSIENPEYDFEVNSRGTFNLLDLARREKVRSLVFASSGAVVGTTSPPILPDDPLRPLSPYGASKAAGEAMIHAFRAAYGLNCAALRFGNIYGPKSQAKGSVVPLFIRKAIAGENLEVFGDGAQKRDFLFVGDLCEAITRAVVRESLPDPVYQLARGEGVSLAELLDHLRTSLKARGRSMPEVRYSPARAGEVASSFYDLELTVRDLDWRARSTFRDGVQNTLDWYLDRM